MSEDLDRSIKMLKSFDVDEAAKLEDRVNLWFEDVLGRLKVASEQQLSTDKFQSTTKPVLSRWLDKANRIMCEQRDVMEKMKETIEQMKTESLADKAAIVRLQANLLENKDEQIKSLQSTVQSTVQATVQQEIKTYSEAVHTTGTPPVLCPDSLKNVVKSAIKEEDRSRNVVVFGLTEEEGEKIEEKITDLFSELDEKPRISASRLGKTGTRSSTPTRPRPVKVSLSSTTAVRQILSKTGKLKSVNRFRAVYVCPDRSIEERTARKGLIMELKQAIDKEPNRRHYIAGGMIHSEDKPTG